MLCYLTLGSFSALPFASGAIAGLSVVDALFESFSGLTTTGATVLSGLEYLPASILFYRQQLQWLGGMGIIVLAVAILPMLGIGLPKQGANTLAYGKRMFEKASFIESLSPAEREIAAG